MLGTRPLLAVSLWLAGCGAVRPLPADQVPFAAPPAQAAAPASVTPVEPLGEALPQRENTFGADSRELVTSADFPWSAVGRLNTGCTATLIDRRLILTAAHCILDPDGGWLADHYLFFPNMVAGRARAGARGVHVWYGTRTPLRPGTPFVEDWAIVLLDRDLGDHVRWLGTRDITPAPGDRVTLSGYSTDVDGGQTATTHVDCQIQSGLLDGQITHDCDMTRGASGGPLWSTAWGEPTIVAVQSIEARDGGDASLHLPGYDGGNPNGAIPVSRFFARLLWVVERF